MPKLHHEHPTPHASPEAAADAQRNATVQAAGDHFDAALVGGHQTVAQEQGLTSPEPVESVSQAVGPVAAVEIATGTALNEVAQHMHKLELNAQEQMLAIWAAQDAAV